MYVSERDVSAMHEADRAGVLGDLRDGATLAAMAVPGSGRDREDVAVVAVTTVARAWLTAGVCDVRAGRSGAVSRAIRTAVRGARASVARMRERDRDMPVGDLMSDNVPTDAAARMARQWSPSPDADLSVTPREYVRAIGVSLPARHGEAWQEMAVSLHSHARGECDACEAARMVGGGVVRVRGLLAHDAGVSASEDRATYSRLRRESEATLRAAGREYVRLLAIYGPYRTIPAPVGVMPPASVSAGDRRERPASVTRAGYANVETITVPARMVPGADTADYAAAREAYEAACDVADRREWHYYNKHVPTYRDACARMGYPAYLGYADPAAMRAHDREAARVTAAREAMAAAREAMAAVRPPMREAVPARAVVVSSGEAPRVWEAPRMSDLEMWQADHVRCRTARACMSAGECSCRVPTAREADHGERGTVSGDVSPAGVMRSYKPVVSPRYRPGGSTGPTVPVRLSR